MNRNNNFSIFISLLFTVNIIVGVVLILSTFSASFSPSNNIWIQAFGLVYPVVFIIASIFLIYWIAVKNKLALISLIFVLVGFSNFFNNFQVTLVNSSDKKQDQTKVLTYNVQNFSERNKNIPALEIKSEILNFLIEQDADIVCVQEYHSTSGNLYKPLKKIRDTLDASTYYYESYFNPRNNQLSGLVIFSKYRAVNKGKLKFTGSRTFGIYTDVIIDNDTVRVFNIHLASIKLKPEDLDFVINPETENSEELKSHSSEIYRKLLLAYELREKQLGYLLKKIKATNFDIILCGDFNDTPSSWAYGQLNNYLDDSFVEKGMGIGRTYAGPLPFLRIDYILATEGYRTFGFTRHDLKKSDHYPISAIIQKKLL